MANDVSAIIPRIFAMGVALVRKNSVMPRLVSNKSDVAQAAKGETVTVPVSQKMTAKDAVPGATAPTDVTPGGAQVKLSEWKDSEFTLTDKEIAEIAGGGPTGVPGNLGGLEIEQWAPAQMVEAVEALVVEADSYALGLVQGRVQRRGHGGHYALCGQPQRHAQRSARREQRHHLRAALLPHQPGRGGQRACSPGNLAGQRDRLGHDDYLWRDRYAARCDVGGEPKRAGVRLDRRWHAASERGASCRRHVVAGRWHHQQHRQAGRQLHHCSMSLAVIRCWPTWLALGATCKFRPD